MSEDMKMKGKLFGQFVCPVALITTEFQGKNNLSIAICIGSGGYTHELLKKSGKFGINMASTTQVNEANLCGSRSGRKCNKLAESGLDTYIGGKTGVPLIKECVANIECKLVNSQQMGGSIIFIGQAVSKRVDETKELLVFFRGSYWKIGELLGKYENSSYWLL